MNNKIIVPKKVADAIAHYVSLADTKTEALTDIIRLGFEAERSEIILRHFDNDLDELMEALICGYEVEVTPEEKVLAFYKDRRNSSEGSSYHYQADGVIYTLDLLGIKIAGVNE
jgi:DNA integrity scanning protein DisA with diadenylate cyclase activity